MSFQRDRPISYDAPPSDSESAPSDRAPSCEPPQTSLDLARFDRQTLHAGDEQQRLLLQSRQAKDGEPQARGLLGGMRRFGGRQSYRDEPAAPEDVQKQGGPRKRQRRSGLEKRELLHAMEEGGEGSLTPSSDEGSGIEAEKKELSLGGKRPSKAARLFRFSLLHILIATLFLAIAFGAYKATTQTRKAGSHLELKSNGTSLFAATTILLSLDGFRADYLQRGLTPRLNAFIREGISPQYMTPSFPSVTFPNHFTLVTGLYPESHGVVGNSFWDIDLKEEFYYTDYSRSMQPKWWRAEPIWETAENQNVRTAIHMWPGSEANIGNRQPAYIDKFNATELLSSKVDRMMELLDKPGPTRRGLGKRQGGEHDAESSEGLSSTSDMRPQLIAAYVPNVDADGHKFGPNSTEIRKTIEDVDAMLEQLFESLEDRNLTDIVNVIVVSDHGMATTSTSRLIQLEDLIDVDLIEHIDGWPHYGLRPKDEADLPRLYDQLVKESSEREGFDAYLRDQNMPERYHFQHNDRIAPLWVMPHTGWAIVTKDEMNVAQAQSSGEVYHPMGVHGYDHEHPLMRAIFVARGPAFPHEPGSKMKVFQNIEVANIVCDSVGVKPHPNNGTLRLPLKPEGVHAPDHPEKPVGPEADLQEGNAMPSNTAAEAYETASSELEQASSGPDVDVPSRPTVNHTEGANGPDPHRKTAHMSAAELWRWMRGQASRLHDWIDDMIQRQRHKGQHHDGNG